MLMRTSTGMFIKLSTVFCSRILGNVHLTKQSGD